MVILRYDSQTDTIEEENVNEKTAIIKPQKIKSALLKHIQEHHHQIGWDKAMVLDKDSKSYRLLIPESLAIKQYQQQLNRSVNSAPFLVFPEGVLIKKPKVKMKTQRDGFNHP